MAVDADRLDLERLQNLVRGFGWFMVKQEFTSEKIIVQLEKPRKTPEGSPESIPG